MKYKIIIIGAICFLALSAYASEDSAFIEKAGELDMDTSTSNSLGDSALSENDVPSSQEEESSQHWIISGFNQVKDKAINLFESISNTFTTDNLSSQAQAQQLTPLSLLSLNDLQDREDIITALQEDMNVSIAVDDPAILNPYLLSYLYNYFKFMLAEDSDSSGRIRIRTPYYLHARSRDNYPMVEVDGENIYVYKNASKNIITKKLHETLEDVDTSSASEIQVTFEYSNELYHQLNRAFFSPEDIKDFVHKHFNISLEVDSENPLSNLTQEFTKEELLIILKTLVDIPPHIRNTMSLTRIVRMPEHNLMVSGLYHSLSESIVIFDNASENFQEVLLHEIAHAVDGLKIWSGLPLKARSSYEDLSWGEHNSLHNSEFVSDYSFTNVAEDFAEHFEAYIHTPRSLMKTAPKKYKWLKEHVFVNTEYTVGPVMDNLEIFVDSDLEDITPPHISDNFDIRISMSVEEEEEEEESLSTSTEDDIFEFKYSPRLIFKVEIDGLFDDISGIKRIELKFKKSSLLSDTHYVYLTSDTPFRDIFQGAQCKKYENCSFFDSNKPGRYILYSSFPAIYEPGTYKLEKITVEDRSLNEKSFYSVNGDLPEISIPGIARPEDEDEEERSIVVSDMHWVQQETKTGDTLRYLMTPVEPNVKWIYVDLKGEDTKRILSYTLDLDDRKDIYKDFESFSGSPVPQEPGFYTIPVVIPAELDSEKYNLDEVMYQSPTADTYTYVLCGNKVLNLFSNPCPGIIHTSTSPLSEEEYSPKPVVEDIQLSILNQTENSKGGNTAIRVNIPITGIFYEDIDGSIRLITPLDKRLYPEDIQYIKSDEGLVLSAQFDLPPHHAEGFYFLSYVSLESLNPNIRRLGSWDYEMDGLELFSENRFSERMIRKTLTIQVPSFEEGQDTDSLL